MRCDIVLFLKFSGNFLVFIKPSIYRDAIFVQRKIRSSLKADGVGNGNR